MAWFKRRKAAAVPGESATAEQGEALAPKDTESTSETAAARAEGGEPEAAPRGPFDVAEAPERPGRVDLGALRIPGVQGMQLRMELDRNTKAIIAVNATLGKSTLQLQAFAAPRSSGIWEEIRPQIAESIGAQGGEVKEVKGPFGTELLALLPVKDANGKDARVPARFLGVDGPRWFLRGVLRGAALVDAKQRALMEAYFSEIVVVRGDDPRPVSELLPLTLPGQATATAPAPGQAPAVDDILKRGPEITEVR